MEKTDFELWYEYFLRYAKWLSNNKHATDEEKSRLTSFYTGTSIEEWPPHHIRNFLYQKDNGDWVLKDKNIPYYIRKEYDKWHNYFLDFTVKEFKQSAKAYQNNIVGYKYEKLWIERQMAIWNNVKMCKYPRNYLYDRYLGMILPNKSLTKMSVEELEDFIEYAKKSRIAWKETVKKQQDENRIPEDFRIQNIHRIMSNYDISESISDEELTKLTENIILNAEDILKEKKNV
jgi:hypothetical protein